MLFVVGLEELESCENIKGKTVPVKRGGLSEQIIGRVKHGTAGRLTGTVPAATWGKAKRWKTSKPRNGHLFLVVPQSPCTLRLKGVYSAWGELDYMNIIFQKQTLVQKWFSLVKNGIMTRLEVKEVVLLAKMKFYLLILEGLISTAQCTGLWVRRNEVQSRLKHPKGGLASSM